MAIVPEELLRKLHDANERLRIGRAKLERVSEMDFASRRQVAEELRSAEAEVEEVTREIEPIVRADPGAGYAPAPPSAQA